MSVCLLLVCMEILDALPMPYFKSVLHKWCAETWVCRKGSPGVLWDLVRIMIHFYNEWQGKVTN